LFSRRLPGRLGRENAVRNPRRTAATAAALMIGLALISAVTVLGSSLVAGVKVNGMQLCDNANCSHAKQVGVTAFPSSALGDLVKITPVDGSVSLKPDTLLVAERAAKSNKLKPGDTVTVQFARSDPQKLTVGGTLR